jgi:hypothetical protein
MSSPPTFFLPTSAKDLPRKCLFAGAQRPRVRAASLVHHPTSLAVRDLNRKKAPLCRSRQFSLTLGNGSDRPAVVTTKCAEFYFGMSWMRLDCRKGGLLAADVAWFRDDVFDPHVIFLPPIAGVKATAAR